MKRPFLTFLIVALFCAAIWAKPNNGRQLLFLKNHFGVGVDLPVMFVDHLYHHGLGELNIITVPGVNLKFDYIYNFNEYCGISTGARMGLRIFRYDAAADASDFNIPNDVEKEFVQLIPFIMLPLYVNPRIFVKDKHSLQMDFGANVTFFTFGSTIGTMNYYDGKEMKPVFEMRMHQNGVPQISMHTGISYGMLLKNSNMMKFGVAYDYSRRTIIEGEYSFNNDDITIGSGKIASSMSYLSIEFSYILTRATSFRKA